MAGDMATPPSGKPLPPSGHHSYASVLRRDGPHSDDDDATACAVVDAMCDADDDCCQGNVATLSSARRPPSDVPCRPASFWWHLLVAFESWVDGQFRLINRCFWQ